MRQAEILLYDLIGEDPWFGGGISALSFAQQLKDLDLRAGDELTIRVNSPGGSTYDGMAMYNSLLAYPAHKIVKVEGLAASAASYVIQAGDDIQVAEASLLMIHRAWSWGMGNADDFVELASILEKNDSVIAGIYARRSKRPEADLLALMGDETWFTAQEAIDAKLADKLIAAGAVPAQEEAAAARALLLVAKFKRAPAALASRFAPALPVAALAIPQNAGQVLNAENKARATTIRDEAQALLDSAAPKETSDSAALAQIRSDLQLCRAELELERMRIDIIEALRG